ncbi:AAA domain-containing protein [Streptococcus thoraltensis]
MDNINNNKFKLWSNRLLDLSKRNHLLSYREKKVGSVIIDRIFPDSKNSDDFYSLYDSFKNEQFNLRFDALYGASENQRIRREKELTSLEKIRKADDSQFEEYGFHITYLVFGSLIWSELGSDELLRTPLVLLPAKVDVQMRNQSYSVTSRDDDSIQLNPVILKVLKDQFNIEIDEDIAGKNLSVILKEIDDKISDKDWSIQYEIILDNFNYQNFVIYKDIERNQKNFSKNKFVKLLLNNGTDSEEIRKNFLKELSLDGIKSEKNLQILDADSSQMEAILRAQRGDSFVLQGPPGTGKSQTITNIIAQSLGLGKKVLFVSEKQAALNVVYNKLKSHGLAPFILTLHNVKKSKTTMKHQLEDSVYLFKDLKPVNRNIYSELDNIRSDLLDKTSTLHDIIPEIETSFFDVQNHLSEFLDVETLVFEIPKELLNKPINSAVELFSDIRQFSIAYINDSQDFLHSSWQYLKDNLNLSNKDDLNASIKDLKDVNNALEDTLQIIQIEKIKNLKNKQIKEFHIKILDLRNKMPDEISKEILDSDFIQLFEVYESYTKTESEFSELSNQNNLLIQNNENLRHQILNDFDEAIFQKSNLESINKLLKFKYSSKLKRIFSKEYKTIEKEFKLLSSTYQIDYEKIVDIVDKMVNYNNNKNAISTMLQQLDIINSQLSKFRSKLSSILVGNYHDSVEVVSWLKQLDLLKDTFDKVSSSFITDLIFLNNAGFRQYVDTLQKYYEVIEKHSYLANKIEKYFYISDDNWYNLSNFINTVDFDEYEAYINYSALKNRLIKNYHLKDFVEKIESKNFSKEEIFNIFRKRFYSAQLDALSYNNEILQKNRSLKDNEVNRFKELDQSYIKIASNDIYNNLLQRLPDINRLKNNEEKQILIKELQKKKNFLPARKLFEKLPNLIPAYKPCIMMSPLTVSTYFSSNDNWDFDLVIFDEASQVKTEYAIGSIGRAKQIIVSGDSKQMPPTSFFGISEMVEEVLEDNDTSDLESILDELSVSLPQIHLEWHYRSSDESLIAFSNEKFYNNRLLTFPSETISNHSNIKYTYVDDAVWENTQGNKKEARQIVQLVIDYFKNYPDSSIGVVAFGMSQSKAIENEIERYRNEHPEVDDYFDENKKEPFFIKNLENVQGDERDIIILSVGYGKQENGKLYMNFGPLTKNGGERRLNVAISRSRKIMHVVSSIYGNDIKSEESANQNRILFKDFLLYAQNGSLLPTNQKMDDIEFETKLEKSIYNFLIAEGYNVKTKIGNSGFKIDLAVVNPNNPDKYLLAIECDGSNYAAARTVRDRERLRQDILESKGWNYYRIWSTNWVFDYANEKVKLKKHIEELLELEDNPDTLKNIEENYDTDFKQFSKFESYNGYAAEIPIYDGYTPYDFDTAENIVELAKIMLAVAHLFVDDDINHWMRHVNENAFNKKRLTKGYQEVYLRAIDLLEEVGAIHLKGFKLGRINNIDEEN